MLQETLIYLEVYRNWYQGMSDDLGVTNTRDKIIQ